MSDGDYADPLAGSGISGDDYDEESWAGDSPWDDPDDDHRFDEEGESSAKKSGEATYREERDGANADAPPDELTKLTRNIRKLQDAQSFRAGVDLDQEASGSGLFFGVDNQLHYGDGSERQEIQVSWSKVSGGVDWVNLPVDHPLLDVPFEWEQGAALIDKTEAPPLGMDPKWKLVGDLVEQEWYDGHPVQGGAWGTIIPANPTPGKYAEAETDAIRDITLRLREEGFDPVNPQAIEQLHQEAAHKGFVATNTASSRWVGGNSRPAG
jgi:hypothetical protein